MPSGRTHDAITFLLAVPASAAAYYVTRNAGAAGVVGAAFLFGGLMFGPDLDTVSRQYSRWYFLRFLWLPYRSFFDHRSRFSHGLIFGALIRVFYFMGVVTLAAYLIALAWTGISDASDPDVSDLANAFGRCFDDAGNRFLCHIRNPIRQLVYDDRYLARNPFSGLMAPVHDAAASGDTVPIYRMSQPEPWRTLNAGRLAEERMSVSPRSETVAAGFVIIGLRSHRLSRLRISGPILWADVSR